MEKIKIEELTSKLRGIKEIDSCVVFGSYTSNDFRTNSDIDILVITSLDLSIDLLPKTFYGRAVDYKILKTRYFNSRIFEKSFQLKRILFNNKKNILFGEIHIQNDLYFEIDQKMKVLRKILKYQKIWSQNLFVDDPRTLYFKKLTYRKLYNLLKTFEEVNYKEIQNYEYVYSILIRLKQDYVFPLGDFSMEIKPFREELKLLITNYTQSIKDDVVLRKLNLEVEVNLLDPVWRIESTEKQLTLIQLIELVEIEVLGSI